MKALPDINERALGRFDDPTPDEQRKAALYVAGRIVQDLPDGADLREAAKGAPGDDLLELLQILGIASSPSASGPGKANGTESVLRPRQEKQ